MGTVKRDLRTSGDLVMAPRVPHGLAAAVEGLTREVIRHKPEDIYVFAAQHFEELLKLRDEYGAVTNLPGKNANTPALREMNQAVKKREIEKGVARNRGRGGWSMKETARVLERHRSIFGDKGRKISSEEVRAMGNEKENKSRDKDDLDRFPGTQQKRRGSNERFVKKRPPKVTEIGVETKSKNDTSGNPKIISQIPNLSGGGGLLAKDIKSELRKNRNSSRDGRSIRERAERKTTERMERLDTNSRNLETSKKTLIRSSRERSLDKILDRENDEESSIFDGRYVTHNQKYKTDANASSSLFAKIPRTLSMDRVREFVNKKFRASESCEELRSSNYVGRVQEVIDDAAPFILRKVQELSTQSAGRFRGYESVDESTSTSTRSDKSNQTDDVRSRSAMSASRRSRKHSKRSKSRTKSRSKISCADSLDGIETLASELEQPKEVRHGNVAAKMMELRSPLNEEESGGRTKSATKGIVNGISGDSDVSDNADVRRKISSGSSGISLPAVRPSSKNASRSVSRSDSDNLVLPPIPPDLPRSAKQREEVVLPSLQVSMRTMEEEEAKETLMTIENLEESTIVLEDTVEVELNLPDAPTEEIFKDSLNVTPEINATPRPDSLDSNDSAEPEDEPGADIVELRSKLCEINSETDDNMKVDPDTIGVDEHETNTGIKERLREIEETEKRIEKILKPEAQESPTDRVDSTSVKEKLIEIHIAEERLKNAFDPSVDDGKTEHADAQEIQGDQLDSEMKEKLVDIEKTETGIEEILSVNAEEVKIHKVDPGMKEKLMEIEETEKRIAKILLYDAQDIHGDSVDSGIREKLMQIEEAEKRIEKILHSDAEGVEADKDILDVERNCTDSEREKIPNGIETEFKLDVPEAGKDEVDAVSIKEKLMEIEEAEKRLRNILDPIGPEVKHENVEVSPVKFDDNFKEPVNDNDSVQKTPLIPEIPCDHVTTANESHTAAGFVQNEQKNVFNNDGSNEKPAQTGNTDEKLDNSSHSKTPERESELELLQIERPNSFGNSYILSEGSPYDIPDSVTTVIIPEQRSYTPSSEILEIVLETNVTEGSVTEDTTGGCKASENNHEISLQNILDNFGEVVQPEAVTASSAIDVDFIRGLKTGKEVLLIRKDLGQIKEEDNKELLTDSGVVENIANPVTPILENISESEEILELEGAIVQAQRSKATERNSSDSDEMKLECTNKGSEIKGNGQSGEGGTESLEVLEPKENSETMQLLGNGKILDKTNYDSGNDGLKTEVKRASGDQEAEPLEILTSEIPCGEPEHSRLTSPTITGLGSLQQNVTDSVTTESTDEVKETTISDDGANTAPESSVTSPSSADNVRVRNSESSNEGKETTISDQPVHNIGKNFFSLVPQCHGTTPYVPELNLDSLQDITVSSFQLSEDGTVDDSEVDQTPRKSDPSLISGTEENQNINDTDLKSLHAGDMGIKNAETTEKLEYEEISVPIAEESADEKVFEKMAELLSENVLEEQVQKISEPEEIIETMSEDVAEKVAESIPTQTSENVPDNIFVNFPEDVALSSIGSQLDTISLQEFKALETQIGEKYSLYVIGDDINDPNNQQSNLSHLPLEKDDQTESNVLICTPKVNEAIVAEDTEQDSTIGKPDAAGITIDPPRAELITNDLDDDGARMEYHIYVPEVTASEDSTTESSTFNSAATKIQAGVRGFLTRRRLQSAQRRSSTLDSVPSIQDSFTADVSHLEPIEEVGLTQAATTIQSNYRGYKARQRLRREDAMQKTTLSLSVENAFSSNGLQHTGEFHDCLAIPPLQDDAGAVPAQTEEATNSGTINSTNQDDAVLISTDAGIQETGDNSSEKSRDSTCTTTAKDDGKDFYLKEESLEDRATFELLVKKYPCQELNLVVVSNTDAVLQSQYLNFITSIEEVRDEDNSFIVPDHSQVIEASSALKSNVGIESLPLDNPCSDISVDSVSVREPLAVPGTPTGIIIEELSKTDEESVPDITSVTSSVADAKSETNLAEGISDILDDSLNLPGLSLEGQSANAGQVVSTGKIGNQAFTQALQASEIAASAEEGLDETPICFVPNVAQDASLGTMSFSMNVDDMLGFDQESEASSKMKPILEVTVTPRDLLKLVNRSQGSQAITDRVESPITMMQIVPKSVEEKSDKSEEDRGGQLIVSKVDEEEEGVEASNDSQLHPAEEANSKLENEGQMETKGSDAIDKNLEENVEETYIEQIVSVQSKMQKVPSDENEESSERTFKTFSIENSDHDPAEHPMKS